MRIAKPQEADKCIRCGTPSCESPDRIKPCILSVTSSETRAEACSDSDTDGPAQYRDSVAVT